MPQPCLLWCCSLNPLVALTLSPEEFAWKGIFIYLADVAKPWQSFLLNLPFNQWPVITHGSNVLISLSIENKILAARPSIYYNIIYCILWSDGPITTSPIWTFDFDLTAEGMQFSRAGLDPDPRKLV
uniref:Uncharacterized protein n=1 Tax=Romanomermis culicivorax TaxID=13658 RepID=A0A915HNP1_ROMCU